MTRKQLQIIVVALLGTFLIACIVTYSFLDRFVTTLILNAIEQPRVTAEQMRSGGMSISPEELGLKGEEIFVESKDGNRQRAWWIPAQAAGVPLVVLLHGFGVRSEIMFSVAERLHGQGYACLCPDNRGFGESMGTPTFGVREVEDAVAFLRRIENKTNHQSPLAVYGGSYGASLALLLGVRLHNVKCVVAFSPFTDLSSVLGDQLNRALGDRRFPFVKGFAIRRFLKIVGASALNDISPLQVLSAAPSRPPIFLVHGTDDQVIPIEHSRRLWDRFPETVTYREIPNAGHDDLFEEKTLLAVDAFLARHLKG